MSLPPAGRSGAGLPDPGRRGQRGGWLPAPLSQFPSPASRLAGFARPVPRPRGARDILAEARAGRAQAGLAQATADPPGLAQASVRGGGCFVRQLPLDTTCASAARSLFREAVSGAGLSDDLIHDGVTMASELAANTLNAHGNIEFAGPGRRPVSGMPEFWLYLRSVLAPGDDPRQPRTVGSGREIVCKIFDSEPGWDAGEPAPVGAAVPAGPDSIRGRGLQLVAGLSAGAWGHHMSRGRLGAWKVPGKAVWFALRVPSACDFARSQRLAPPGGQAIEELAAALADRGLGARLVQVNEPGGEMAVLSICHRLTVWCFGDIVWWQLPDGQYDRLAVSDLVEATERIVCAHEELVGDRHSPGDADACAAEAGQQSLADPESWADPYDEA